MKTNYHTHTYRCGHAEPNERAYIECAIKAGFDALGFADHCPQVYPDGYTSGIRMPPEDAGAYIRDIAALKEEYRGKIDIHIGFETEYYPSLFNKLLTLLEPHPYEYLILGQHSLGDEIGEPYMGGAFDDERTLTRYVDQCTEAMETGAFSYIAHPDLPRFTGSKDFYRTEMRRLCRAAVACNVPMEFNLSGFGAGIWYPSPILWEEATAVGAVAILGWDAHQAAFLGDTHVEALALARLDELGIKRIDHLDLIRPHPKNV